MSDACWWKKEWIDAVVERIKDYPMHLFVFLTKRPDLLLKNYHWETRPRNIIIGVTSTTQKEIDNVDRHVYTRFYSTLINIEPMHGKIELDPVRLFYTTWIILGAETGNRKGKILPQKEWIASIMRQCSASRIPLFMKDNLRQVWYGEMVQNRIAF